MWYVKNGMIKELDRDIKLLNKHFDIIRRQYRVKHLGIFGSVAKGTQTKKSDIDLLVEFSGPIGLFSFVRLERELSEILGRKVDLVSKDGLKPIIRDSILEEVIYV